MTLPPYIGINGVKGAGKDTVCARLIELAGSSVKRFSVADPLKRSVAALLRTDEANLEEWKNDPHVYVDVVRLVEHRVAIDDVELDTQQLVDGGIVFRRFLELYGTEAHRDVFGEDFWLEHWRTQAQRMHMDAGGLKPWLYLTGEHQITIVNTSVRFQNEAQWIRENGGVVWHVTGTDEVERDARDRRREDGSFIPSEQPLPDEMIDARIDNSHRGSALEIGEMDWHPDSAHDPVPTRTVPDFQHIDDQLATLIANHGVQP